MASCVGQYPAPVVVALAVTPQPLTRDELVVVQLEESAFLDVRDTQKSVNVDSEQGVSEGKAQEKVQDRGRGPSVIRVIESQSWPRNAVK